MRAAVKYASVCAGALIVALWIGAGTAWAAPSTNEEPSGATSTAQTTTGGLSISRNGQNVVQRGSSTATTNGRSTAIAFDLPGSKPSTATANGDKNFVLAINGSNARADGNGNFVFAGDDSESIATGNDNDVRAAFGSTNRVTGNGNTSYAIPNSHNVVTGNNNTAVALCGGAVTISGNGQRVTDSRCGR